MYRLAFSILCCVLLGMIACESTPTTSQKPTFTDKVNLLEYGVPVTLAAPAGTEVVNNSDEWMQDLVLKGENYYIQVYGRSATSGTCKTSIQETLRDLKTTDANFRKVVREDDCGFIYAVQSENDTTTYYNFNYHKIQGNKFYSFATTSSYKSFNLEQAEAMYEAVKNHE